MRLIKDGRREGGGGGEGRETMRIIRHREKVVGAMEGGGRDYIPIATLSPPE